MADCFTIPVPPQPFLHRHLPSHAYHRASHTYAGKHIAPPIASMGCVAHVGIATAMLSATGLSALAGWGFWQSLGNVSAHAFNEAVAVPEPSSALLLVLPVVLAVLKGK